MNVVFDVAAPTRPVVRWHGGKWKLAPWLISHFPPHRIYTEPYGGSAAVLMRKPRALHEVYNDRDGEIVNVFRMLRDHPAELERLCRLTPAARDEYEACGEATDDPLERARRYLFRRALGHGGEANGFRPGSANKRRGHEVLPAREWHNYPDAIAQFASRLARVTIENRDGPAVMLAHDDVDALHYVDPTYLEETRSSSIGYKYELTEADHEALLDTLNSVRGMVALSGYHSALYDRSLKAWRRTETPARADGARDRVEVLWTNPQACAALDESLKTALDADHG